MTFAAFSAILQSVQISWGIRWMPWHYSAILPVCMAFGNSRICGMRNIFVLVQRAIFAYVQALCLKKRMLGTSISCALAWSSCSAGFSDNWIYTCRSRNTGVRWAVLCVSRTTIGCGQSRILLSSSDFQKRCMSQDQALSHACWNKDAIAFGKTKRTIITFGFKSAASFDA